MEERKREMNGFAEHGLDEGAFGEKGSNIVKAFDAFRKCFTTVRSFGNVSEQLDLYAILSLSIAT